MDVYQDLALYALGVIVLIGLLAAAARRRRRVRHGATVSPVSEQWLAEWKSRRRPHD
jgi:hypothetical protein